MHGNVWHHAAVTYNGANVWNMYLDGELDCDQWSQLHAAVRLDPALGDRDGA